MSTMTFGRAINTGLRKAMEHDSKVVLIGEDIGKLGGVFRITDELQKDFGAHRVIAGDGLLDHRECILRVGY